MPEDDCAIINGHKKPGELAVVVLTPVEHLFDRCVQQQTTGTSLEKKTKIFWRAVSGILFGSKTGAHAFTQTSPPFGRAHGMGRTVGEAGAPCE
jgi:hypothetical protein